MIRPILLGCVLAAAVLSPAAADTANLLGVFKNWTAYSTGTGDAMTCYAISKPRAVEPKRAKRDPIFLMVSDWPARKAKGEPEIVPGYAYKLGRPVAMDVNGKRFDFFSRNDGKAGSAWIQNLGDMPAFLDAMTQGVSAVAIGYSARGTKTVDTYSLAGFTDALAKIHAACKM